MRKFEINATFYGRDAVDPGYTEVRLCDTAEELDSVVGFYKNLNVEPDELTISEVEVDE